MTPKCENCKYWDKDGDAPGRMPGVRDDYRVCSIPTMHKRVLPDWRSPESWCIGHVKREDTEVPS